MNLVKLSAELLLCAKHGRYSSQFHTEFHNLSLDDIVQGLKHDEAKVAFWCNVYNAFIIDELAKSSGKPGDLYTKHSIVLKDLKLSFDDIEHGILRRSKVKWSLGYLGKPKVEEWELLLRVNQMDPRIHFALNCGANSCPPIAIYRVDTLDRQLDDSTRNYLSDTSVITGKNGNLKVPRIFLWYMGDFGGFEGIKKLYMKYNLVPIDTKPKISFLAYDWSLNIDNFSNDT